MNGWSQRLEALTPKSLPACILALSGCVAIYFPVVAGVAMARSGTEAIYATLTAAMVCWFSASLSLVVVACFRDPRQRVIGVLGGMLIRMMLPLGAGLLLSRAGGQLAAHGIFGQIVAFYLFTLVVETWLSLSAAGMTQSPAPKASGSHVAES